MDSTAATDREFSDGDVIAGTRYRVVQRIGVGGMGSIYEVEHVELGKRFVLKTLQRALAARADLVARLRTEWRSLARLEHRNIVAVTDAGASSDGVPFFVMERLEGQTLAERLRAQGRLSPEQAVDVILGILDGLGAAHDIGIVHRDVKPPNVFLTRDGVKLLDFGVAKVLDRRTESVTVKGLAVGTPRYMSPEQARGESPDGRSDLYSTGLILFELLTGRGPFDDSGSTDVLLAQISKPPPSLGELCADLPTGLEALVTDLLEKDPRDRPASARVVSERLRSLRSSPAGDATLVAPLVPGETLALPETPTVVTRAVATGRTQRIESSPVSRDPAPSHPDAAGPTRVDPSLSGATTEVDPSANRTVRLAPPSNPEITAPTRTAMDATPGTPPPVVPASSSARPAPRVPVFGLALGAVVLLSGAAATWVVWGADDRGTQPAPAAQPMETVLAPEPSADVAPLARPHEPEALAPPVAVPAPSGEGRAEAGHLPSPPPAARPHPPAVRGEGTPRPRPRAPSALPASGL